MDRRCIFGLLLLCCFQFCPVYPLTCASAEYEKSGRCCRKCPAGQKVASDCTETTETQCTECSDGEYQTTMNQEKACHLHRYCDHNAGLIVKTPGTAVADVVCECMAGRHCSSEECATCVTNTLCDLGYGVFKKALHASDTVCEPCPAGTFSSVSSSVEPCHNFTRCENLGMVVKEQGTSTSDVTCEFRSHTAVIVTVVVISVALVGVALFLLLLRIRRCVKKKMQQEGGIMNPPPEQEKKPMIPEEIGLDDPDLAPPEPPIQETLSGQQPVVQEEGKDSRIPQQEIV